MHTSLSKQRTLHVYTARLMELNNLIRDALKGPEQELALCQLLYLLLITCLSPIAPHVCSELSQLTTLKPKILG